MKGIFCSLCYSIHSLPRGNRVPVKCDCGNLEGWWIDGERGIARFYAKDAHAGYMVGWNNVYLKGVGDFHITDTYQGAKEIHDVCTNAPNHIFDKNRMACWTVILRPGRTSDTAWASPEEYDAAHKEKVVA